MLFLSRADSESPCVYGKDIAFPELEFSYRQTIGRHLQVASVQLPCCIVSLCFTSTQIFFFSGGCELLGGLPYIHGWEGQPLVVVPSYFGRKRQLFMATKALRHLRYSSRSLEKISSKVFDVCLACQDPLCCYLLL